MKSAIANGTVSWCSYDEHDCNVVNSWQRRFELGRLVLVMLSKCYVRNSVKVVRKHCESASELPGVSVNFFLINLSILRSSFVSLSCPALCITLGNAQLIMSNTKIFFLPNLKEEMISIMPLVWSMVLLHLRVSLILYEILKRTSQELERHWRMLPSFKAKRAETST